MSSLQGLLARKHTSVLSFRRGRAAVEIITADPVECPTCHVMHCFFTARCDGFGVTWCCWECDGRRAT